MIDHAKKILGDAGVGSEKMFPVYDQIDLMKNLALADGGPSFPNILYAPKVLASTSACCIQTGTEKHSS